MSKKYVLIILAIATIIIGIIFGVFISGKDRTSNIQPEIETKLAKGEDTNNELQAVITSTTEIKTSPNCIFVFQTYYNECKHTTEEMVEIPKRYVNETEEELQIEYKDWKIKEFDSIKVIFYKEIEGICDEHYIIKENNGYIAIYNIDSNGRETLKEATEISTYYLPETDQMRLKEGIKVEGHENLNAIIEDYE